MVIITDYKSGDFYLKGYHIGIWKHWLQFMVFEGIAGIVKQYGFGAHKKEANKA